MFTKEELGTILNMIDFTWQNGGVRSEPQAMAFNRLKVKTENMLKNPLPEVPAPTPGKKDDCGNCKDKKKPVKKPDGPPKAKPVDEPVDEPDVEQPAEG